MKPLVIFCFLFAFSNTAISQLLNGSFEDLYINDLGIQEAEHWQTNNDTLGWWVYYDSTAYHKEHPALLLGYQADSGWTGCQSRLWQEISDPQLADGDVLSFYSYSHPTPNRVATEPHFVAEIRYYKEGSYVSADRYIEDEFTSDYSYKELPITVFDADSLVVIFVSGAQPEATDGCGQHTNTYVDKVELGKPLSSAVVDETDLKVYPYAAFGYVTIKGEVEKVDRYAIYDMSGRLVNRGSSVENSIQLPGAGMYVLQVITIEGAMQSFKFANF